MKLRLAGGVVAGAGLGAWVPRPSGPARIPADAEAPPGAAIALGPADAPVEAVRHAAAGLAELVRAGGTVAAGAGVDLGGGFRSACLDGARGDQRDAVLAALRVLGVEGAGRLGPRAGVLVALFGPDATRPVGAAATRAIAEGRWAALHLASAASDMLGPEQLEQILALTEPECGGLIPGGLPSALAANLRPVLEPMPGPRRLQLLLDLWAAVSAHLMARHDARVRRERRLATQARQDRLDDLRKRRQAYEDEQILRQVKYSLHDTNPSMADIARWTPTHHYWYQVLKRLLNDAFAATALLRTASAVGDHGMAEGLARSVTILDAVLSCADEHPEKRKSTGLPPRPLRYVRDIRGELKKFARLSDDRVAQYAKQRLARARAYAEVTIEAITDVLDRELPVPEDVLAKWITFDLGTWREKAGYARPPANWGGLQPWAAHVPGRGDPLAARLAEDPAAKEVIGDFLWYADLIDELARLHGHDAATISPYHPWFDHDPPAPEPEPLTPRLDSVTLAISGAAQLVALGGVTRGAKTWSALVDDLRSGTTIAEALSGEFTVPPPLDAVDGTPVPGTGARVRIARTARTLAEWSDYMGNCIASPGYVEDATRGKSVLLALYDKNDLILVNAELVPTRSGWHVSEIAARFNDSPDATIEKRFRRWVSNLPAMTPTEPEPPSPDWAPPTRRRVRPRLAQDVGPRLGELATQAWADQVTPATLTVLAAVADTPPEAALTQLRRMSAAQLQGACLRANAVDLWRATSVRPLDTVVAEHFDQLGLLLENEPLPRAFRQLVRLPEVAPAYSLSLVSRRIRAAMGDLTCQNELSLPRRTPAAMLCAFVVAVTCRAPEIDLTLIAAPRAVTVPGFPVSALNDELWQSALPAARELGADTSVFWDRIAEDGLRIPTRWLGPGGWPALWAGATSSRRR
ncbi:hypothetical protein [Actinomadura rudentiformis]|uniref:Uncharacterized protein n=1 Tax=Actinomadura rudentiformis TaxID=359158 RepID=A0A6H9YZR9_9ACTN|nr:hypothetical protein [Actinomadura rudentiformis]KAB2347513.1 hypothetical protein F8566_21200 [Actinomadura rudentiformis]